LQPATRFVDRNWPSEMWFRFNRAMYSWRNAAGDRAGRSTCASRCNSTAGTSGAPMGMAAKRRGGRNAIETRPHKRLAVPEKAINGAIKTFLELDGCMYSCWRLSRAGSGPSSLERRGCRICCACGMRLRYLCLPVSGMLATLRCFGSKARARMAGCLSVKPTGIFWNASAGDGDCGRPGLRARDRGLYRLLQAQLVVEEAAMTPQN